MRLRFAIWEQGPAVYFSDEAREQIIEAWGPSPRIEVLLIERNVELHHSADGRCIKPSSKLEPSGWPFVLGGSCEYEYVARSAVFEVSFLWKLGGYLSADIPPPHELPWPRYHEYVGGEFDKHAAVVREIRARQASAELYQTSRSLSLPAHVQSILTAPERTRYFQEFVI